MRALILSCTILLHGSLALGGQSSGFKEVPELSNDNGRQWQQIEVSPAEFRQLLRQALRGYDTIILGKRAYRVQQSSAIKEFMSAIDEQSRKSGLLILPQRD